MDKYFEILGLNTNATFEEVKKAYRDLSKKYHPDFYENDEIAKELATEKFRKINEAYEEVKKYFETKEEIIENNPNTFKWQNYTWTLDNNLIFYNLLRKEIQNSLKTELMWYESTYKAYGDLENFVYYNKKFVQERIEQIFNILSEICIKNGINMYSGKILNQKYFNIVAENYQHYYNYCKNFLDDINRRNQDRQYKLKVKELNDICRGKNGVLNKAMRGTESFMGGIQDNQEKQNFYSDSSILKNLKSSFEEAIFKCLEVVVKLLDIQLEFDEMLSESIIENIQKYPQNQLSERLMEALKKNPYNLKIYLTMLTYFGDKNCEIERISNYFGIGIRDFKTEILKEQIEKFKQSDLENLDYHLENLKSEIVRLGLNIEDYTDLIKKEIKIKKNKAINECIEKFKQSDLENLDYHLENLKSKIVKLGLNLKNYNDMIEETIRTKKDQKATECIKNFKNLLKKDRIKAEEELKAEMSKFGLKLEEYIDINKEYERFDKNLKDKKMFMMLIAVIIIILGIISYREFKPISIKPINRITNNKILDIDTYLTNRYEDGGYNHLKQVSDKYFITYTTFEKEDEYNLAYSIFIDKGDNEYVIYCLRNGIIALDIYSYDTNSVILSIPNMEKTKDIYSEHGKIEKLTKEQKDILKNANKMIKLMKKFDKVNNLNLGL